MAPLAPVADAPEHAGLALRGDLDARTALLPTAAHRATANLGLGVMAAKHHLRRERDDGWPAALLSGPPETWKTQAARLLSVMVGLPWTRTVRQVATQTVRSLWGRWATGRDATATFARSEALSGPGLCADDVDQAGEPAIRKALWSLTLGQSVVVEEGAEQDIAPLICVTFNTGPEESAPPLGCTSRPGAAPSWSTSGRCEP